MPLGATPSRAASAFLVTPSLARACGRACWPDRVWAEGARGRRHPHKRRLCSTTCMTRSSRTSAFPWAGTPRITFRTARHLYQQCPPFPHLPAPAGRAMRRSRAGSCIVPTFLVPLSPLFRHLPHYRMLTPERGKTWTGTWRIRASHPPTVRTLANRAPAHTAHSGCDMDALHLAFHHARRLRCAHHSGGSRLFLPTS